MGDVVHQLLPGRKSSRHSEEVMRDSTSCTNCKGLLVLRHGLTGSDLVTCFGKADGNTKWAHLHYKYPGPESAAHIYADSPNRWVLPAWEQAAKPGSLGQMCWLYLIKEEKYLLTSQWDLAVALSPRFGWCGCSSDLLVSWFRELNWLRSNPPPQKSD